MTLFSLPGLESLLFSAERKKTDEKTLSRIYVHALEELTDELESDLAGISRSARALFSVYSQSPEFPSDFDQLALHKISKAFQNSSVKAVQCIECMKVSAKLEEQDFVIKRGFDSENELHTVLEKFKIYTYISASLNIVSNSMVLAVSVLDFNSKETLFQKDYRTPVIQFESSGEYYALSFGAMRFPSRTLPGLRFDFGRYLAGTGSTGLMLSAYADEDTRIDRIYTMGIYLDADLNDLVEWYWTWGTLYLSADTGLVLTRTSYQGTGGAGMKIDIGSIHFGVVYNTYYMLQKKDKIDVEDPDKGEPPLQVREKLPNAIIAGFGLNF